MVDGPSKCRLRLFRLILALLVLAMPIVAGCAVFPHDQLTQAYGQYTDKDYVGASVTLDLILNKHPRHPESGEAYYLRAWCRTQQSQRARATADVLSCLKCTKDKDLKSKAHAMAGTLLFETDRTGEAIPHYRAALPGFSGRPFADLVYYRYALCLQREGRWKEGRLQFATVFQHYPDSTCAAHARRMHDWRDDYFSIQCGAFREEAGATALRVELKKAGLRGRVETRARSGEMLYVVYVGRYPRYDQATQALGDVRRRVSDAIVVP